LESENANAKVCDAPLPEFGVTDTAEGGEGDCPLLVTVQVPNCDQPLSCAAFCVSIYTFFAPANAALKLSARFNVNVFPVAVNDDDPRFNVHWLF